MKIKHQFFILSLFIISIPVLCAAFVSITHYLHSPERVLIKGTKEIKIVENQTKNFSTKEWKEIRNTMKHLPLDVEAILIDQEHIVLYSTFPDIPLGSKISQEFIWNYVNSTSGEFLYQFSSPHTEKFSSFLITRVKRFNKADPQKRNREPGIFSSLTIILIIIVIISCIIITLISKTIFRSIETVENKTKELAAGNLSSPITTTNKLNEITSTLNSLETMRKAILELQNKKTLFIMGISHDLRTPVAVIKGYIEAIHDGFITSPEEMNTTLELIQGKTAQLQNMIDTLISYTKMNDYSIKEKFNVENICGIIESFTNEAVITGEVYKRKVTKNINLPPEILIKMDKQLVQRLLENIYSNAIRYTNDGDEISFEAYKDEASLFIKIRDTGIGIEEENLPHIFDLFYRETSSRREQGMGIGLSVVKNIIDIHGWNIQVDSKKDDGTCFTITVPLS